MRLHEIMGIEQSRNWGVCSLNDFRKSLGLKRKSSGAALNFYVFIIVNSVFELLGVEH